MRPYRPGDANQLVILFCEAIHQIGATKYSVAQLRAWAPRVPDPEKWEPRMLTNATFIAERSGFLTGFLELELNGYVNMLYRVPGDLGKGVADALYEAAEGKARSLGLEIIYTDASLVAESFFIRHGYRLDARESVRRDGILLDRARMSKTLDSRL